MSKGRGIGGGDIKLMAATGLLIGWKLNLAAAIIDNAEGSIAKIIIAAIKKGDRVLTLSP